MLVFNVLKSCYVGEPNHPTNLFVKRKFYSVPPEQHPRGRNNLVNVSSNFLILSTSSYGTVFTYSHYPHKPQFVFYIPIANLIKEHSNLSVPWAFHLTNFIFFTKYILDSFFFKNTDFLVIYKLRINDEEKWITDIYHEMFRLFN